MKENDTASSGHALAHLCPSCGKELDPLRAGHVAILEGRFVYFCNLACKESYLQRPSLEARHGADTMVPPKVELMMRPGFDSLLPPPVVLREQDAVREQPPETEGAAPPTLPAAAMVETGPTTNPGVAALPTLEREYVASSDPPPRTIRPPPARTTGQSASRARQRSLPSWRSLARSLAFLLALLAAGIGFAMPQRAALGSVFAIAAAALYLAQGFARDISQRGWFTATLLPALGALSALAIGLADAAILSPMVAALGLVVVARVVFDTWLDSLAKPVENWFLGLREALADDAGGRAPVGEIVVKPGDIERVAPGVLLRADGVLEEGELVIRPWYGAHTLETVRPGQAVLAGARVVQGDGKVAVTRVGKDRLWLRAAGLGVGREIAPTERLLGHLANFGVPGMVVVGAAVGILHGAAAVLALGAASVLAFAVGGFVLQRVAHLAHASAAQAALRRGTAYLDGRSFERTAQVDMVVLCTRGVLLLDDPDVVVVEAFQGATDRVLGLAAGVFAGVSDPLARAIVRSAEGRGLRPEDVRSTMPLSGMGVSAVTPRGEPVLVGTRGSLLRDRVSAGVADARVTELELLGHTVIIVCLSGRAIGVIALHDGLRSGARALVQKLHDAQIEPVLLGGESRDAMDVLGRAVDVDHVRPEILPVDRGAQVRELRDAGQVVAVIGDPLVDDLALGASHVSVCLGASASLSPEWSIEIVSKDLTECADALLQPRRTRLRVLRAAAIVVAAFGLAFALLALGVLSVPMAAIVVTVFLAIAIGWALPTNVISSDP